MAEIEKVKLPNDNTIYDIKDAKAIRGLASGTTSGHVLQFGADGYTVSDSGKSMSDKQDTIDSSHKLSADLIDNSTPTFATATQGGKADTAVQIIKVNSASTGVTKTGDTVDITAIPASIVSAGALVNGMTATTQETSDDSTKVATTAFVHDVVDLLPSPMVFKGSLGTGGTITTLPTASSSNKGYVYKVITAGTYASQAAKVGDTFISDGSAWVLIPSGDEPSGTVTNVAVANGGGLTVSGSPITSSGTITVEHSNSVTAKTSSSLKKFTYDAYGHVTGSSELSTAESDALASGIDSTKVAQINTNQTNIGKVQTQANWNTNNGVKNLATINNFSHTGYNKDVPVDGSLTGNVTVYIGNIISTDTDANQCAVLFIYTDDTSSPIHLVNRGTASSFSANLEAKVLKSVRIYSSDNYVHSSGDTVTVTNLMVCPKSLYDADSTYEPYALPNTKITPELIELVDSGAKNLWATPNGTVSGWRETFTGVLPKGDYVISFTNLTSTDTDADTCQIIGVKNGSVVSNYAQCPRGNNVYTTLSLTSDIDGIWIYSSNSSGSGDGDTATFTGCMICTKAAWDVSQKFVPYRPTYEETVEQVAENKNNISSAQNQINYNTNTGVKNLLKENTITFTGTSRDIAATPMKGEMVISLASAVSSDTDASTCTIIIYATDDSTIATKSLSRGVAWNSTFTTGEKTLGKITVYSSDNYVHGSGDTATYTDMMICLKSIYNNDSSYQPYAPTNAELYDMIKALES